MKIAIVGTGAMGSVYAGLFASAGHEVWAIDAWREHVEAMKKNGLRLEGASGDRTVDDIANMALYLCSPFGATISGQALSVDGDQQRLG